LAPGDTINGFISGVSQTTDPGAIIGAGATALYDQMPESLTFAGTYTVNANAFCAPDPPITVCYDDDHASIAYSDGWHLATATGASGGHFRLHSGNSSNHSASLTFNVAPGKTGKLSYHYATSTKGGSAQIFLDNVRHGTINYSGSSGKLKDPVFGSLFELANIPSGSHTLLINNMTDAVYIDGFCLESSVSTGQPASGPGPTMISSGAVEIGQTLSRIVPIGSDATAISVIAESSNDLPIRLVLVDPSGSVLQIGDSSKGVATISAPVSQSGNFIVKVISLNLGPVQVWTAVTPTVRR
jgi:hypothetical protein